jgi:hypothetical protein
VAHACNPSDSEGRDQENHSSKPVQARQIVSRDPISKKKKNHKKELVEWLSVGPKFKL